MSSPFDSCRIHCRIHHRWRRCLPVFSSPGPAAYLGGLRGVQDELRQLLQHLVEGAGHVGLGQLLAQQVGQQAGRELAVAGLALQGEAQRQGGELELVSTQV